MCVGKYPEWMYKLVSSALLILLVCGTVTAQDPQFSQFYAAPLYLNPAFAGATGQARIGANYRNQWPAIDANFNTISAFADFYNESKNVGFGAIITKDREGLLGLQSTSIGLMASYDLKITQGLSFRPGFQASVYNRSINFDKLTFGDQFDPTTGQVVNPTSVEGLNTGQSKFFPDMTLGGLFYSKNGWFRITVAHITQPDQSLVGSPDRLPMKISGHGGWKIYFILGEGGPGIFYNTPGRIGYPQFLLFPLRKIVQKSDGVYI